MTSVVDRVLKSSIYLSFFVIFSSFLFFIFLCLIYLSICLSYVCNVSFLLLFLTSRSISSSLVLPSNAIGRSLLFFAGGKKKGRGGESFFNDGGLIDSLIEGIKAWDLDCFFRSHSSLLQF